MATSLRKIVCGIKFRPCYRIFDDWGEIADKILYKSKFFDSDYFPISRCNFMHDCTLEDPQKENSLVVTPNNLIYTHNLSSTLNSDQVKSEIDKFSERITKEIINAFFVPYSVVTQRIGYVFYTEFSSEEIETYAKKVFQKNITNVTNFRFSVKEGLASAQNLANLDDYIVKIYQVGNFGDFDGISFDYQHFFEPNLSDIVDKIDPTLRKAYSLFKDEILSSKELKYE